MNDGAPTVLLKQGDDAYGRGDYATALEVYRSLAEQGNANAEYYLGVMSEFGHGVEKDSAAAVTWYRNAAEGGSVLAQLKLGLIHDEGLGGVPQDRIEGKYYDKTKNFTAFSTIEQCLESGGRHPKRGQGDCSKATAVSTEGVPGSVQMIIESAKGRNEEPRKIARNDLSP